MRVLVVDCLGCGSTGKRYATLDVIGVGPRLIVGIIESLGHKADLRVCGEVIEDPSIMKGFDVVFVSGMSTDIESMVKVISKWVEGPSVAGGPCFVNYEELLNRGFTYVVWGEAELCLPKLLDLLCDKASVEDVPNLIYRDKKGRVIKNKGPSYAKEPLLWSFDPSIRVIKNYPYWYASRVYVEVVRGCSNFFRPTIQLPDGTKCIGCGRCFNGDLEERLECPLGIPPGCGYCSVPALFGPARSRPKDKIVKEVKELIKLGVKRIVLSAPDFLDYGRDWLVKPKPLTNPREPPPNLEAIESLLKELTALSEVSNGEVYIMIENVKPNLVNQSVAKVLSKYLKDSPVNIGLETGDDELHKALGRPSTVEEVIEAVRLLINAGLKPYVYLIHGLPGESKSSVKKTIRVVKELAKLGVEKFILYRFTPLKGTAFENFKAPPPAIKSPTAKKLYMLIIKLNKELKRRYLGRNVKVIGASYEKGILIAYTLPHGPVVKVVNGSPELVGKVFTVRIQEIVSDRVVCGKIVN